MADKSVRGGEEGLECEGEGEREACGVQAGERVQGEAQQQLT